MSAPTAEDTRNWDAAEIALAEVLPGYEPRAEQTNLAHFIEQAMIDGVCVAAQAGTGTGKSFAALIPSILHALKSGKSVVVATGTKGLQGQYSLEDIPFLVEKLAGFWGTPIRTAELKGRSNYACLSKLNDSPDVDYLAQLLAELNANPEHHGDLERFETVKVAPRDRMKLASSSEECPGASSCPFGSECYAVKASNRARNAQLVITNHALLAVDLMISTAPSPDEAPVPVLLPDYDVVIVDEAQEFENYVTNALGSQLTEGTFAALGTQVDAFTDNPRGSRHLMGSVTRLFREMGDLVPPRGEGQQRLTDGALDKVRKDLDNITEELEGALGAVKSVVTEGDDRLKSKQRRLATRIQGALNKLSVLAPWEDDTEPDVEPREDLVGEVVRWVTREGDKVIMGYSPLSIANFLHHKLWAHKTGVLLSATLANGTDFSYIPGLLGMREYRSFDAGTPFDYPEQARIWIPRDMHPSKDRAGWLGLGHNTTYDLITAAGGRALLLFTSRSAMDQRWDALADLLDESDIPCRRQEAGVSADELIRWKNENPTGVVFGLKSLMQGVSVKDPNALRLVILDKAPFPVPSEVVFQARSDAMDAAAAKRSRKTLDKAKWEHDGSFFGMSIPIMMLVLLQAFGRLIRSRQHEGLMVILDSRLHPEVGPGYGKKVYRNLPEATPLETKREAVQYLRGFNT